MTPERYKEVSRLYHDALELEPARRTAYLAEACGGGIQTRCSRKALATASDLEWTCNFP